MDLNCAGIKLFSLERHKKRFKYQVNLRMYCITNHINGGMLHANN
ncbi:hypothetical protein C5S53_00875 [Methanophagales archaeon]|nr:hypothetical protein C5S53_00875 [Methanophagales archaeon]